MEEDRAKQGTILVFAGAAIQQWFRNALTAGGWQVSHENIHLTAYRRPRTAMVQPAIIFCGHDDSCDALMSLPRVAKLLPDSVRILIYSPSDEAFAKWATEGTLRLAEHAFRTSLDGGRIRAIVRDIL